MAWVIQNLGDGGWLTGPRRYESFFDAYNQWNSLNGKYGRYRIAREKIKSVKKEKVIIKGCLVRYDVPMHSGIVIKEGAFQEDNGKCVPIVVNWDFQNPDFVVGSMTLKNHDDGMYYSAVLNQMPKAKEIIRELKEKPDDFMIGMYANCLNYEELSVIYGRIIGGCVTKRCDNASYISEVVIKECQNE